MPVDGDPEDACVAVDEEAVTDIFGHRRSGCRGEAEDAFYVHFFSEAGNLKILRAETRAPLR